jgi:hypothetical protein
MSHYNGGSNGAAKSRLASVKVRHIPTCGAFNCFAREPREMAIHTGLSVTVAGHVISLERDEGRKYAKLVVRVIDGHVVTGLEGEAIKAAARLLHQRAQRFLGIDWTVEGLTGNYAGGASAARAG